MTPNPSFQRSPNGRPPEYAFKSEHFANPAFERVSPEAGDPLDFTLALMKTNHPAAQLLLALSLLLVSHLSVATEGSGLLNKLGLKEGQSYPAARAALVKRGWQIDYSHAENNQTLPYGFKEVVCGEGWQAVCSARFTYANQEILLTLHPEKQLLVEGAWNDKP